MALSANVVNVDFRTVIDAAPYTVIAGAGPIFNTALVMADGAAAEPFDGVQTKKVLGWHFGDVVGTAVVSVTPGSVAAANTHAKITPGGFRWNGLAVTAAAGDATDLSAPVYATDDGTYTITDPGSGVALGYVVGFVAAGVADVYFPPIS